MGRDPSAPLVDVVPHREEDVEQQVEEHLRRREAGQTRQAPEGIEAPAVGEEVEAHRRRVHRGVLRVGRHREARVEEKLREVRARRAADVDAGRLHFPLEDGDDVRDEEHGEPHDAVDDRPVEEGSST